MAGYKRKPKQYRLKFKDPDMDGFECLTRSCSVEEFTEMSEMSAEMSTGTQKDVSPLLERLCSVILEWNLEDDDDKLVPIAYAQCKKSGKNGKPGHPCKVHGDKDEAAPPCEYAGLFDYDIDFSMQILMAWMGAVVSVDPTLLPGLSNGETSQEDITTQLANMSRSQES